MKKEKYVNEIKKLYVDCGQLIDDIIEEDGDETDFDTLKDLVYQFYKDLDWF